jgi:hypothetical protein
MAKILREYNELNYKREMILEMKEKNQPIVVPALLQRADEKNQNGRIYPKTILEREIENYEKAVKERRAIGQLDHSDKSIVELKDAALLVTEIWWENNNVKGLVEVLNTPCGDILRKLLESGVRVGMSSRGVGEVKEGKDGSQIVEDDFALIAFDAVGEPSTINAWLNESKNILTQEYIKECLTKNDRINRICNEILLKRK